MKPERNCNKQNSSIFYGYSDDSPVVLKANKKLDETKNNGCSDSSRDKRQTKSNSSTRTVSSQQITLHRRAWCDLFGPYFVLMVILVLLQVTSFIFLHYQLEKAERQCYTQQDKIQKQFAKLMVEFRVLKTDTAFLQSIQGVQLLHKNPKLDIISDDEEYDSSGLQPELSLMDTVEKYNTNGRIFHHPAKHNTKQNTRHNTYIPLTEMATFNEELEAPLFEYSGDGGQWSDNEQFDSTDDNFQFKRNNLLLPKAILSDNSIKHNYLEIEEVLHSKDNPSLNEVFSSDDLQPKTYNTFKSSSKKQHYIKKRFRRSPAHQDYRRRSMRDHRVSSNGRHYTPVTRRHSFDESNHWSSRGVNGRSYRRANIGRTGRGIGREYDASVNYQYGTPLNINYNQLSSRRDFSKVVREEYNAPKIEQSSKRNGNYNLNDINVGGVRVQNTGNVRIPEPVEHGISNQNRESSKQTDMNSVRIQIQHNQANHGIDALSQKGPRDEKYKDDNTLEDQVQVDEESADSDAEAEKSWLQLTSYAKIPVSLNVEL